jgi:hypothetical protein
LCSSTKDRASSTSPGSHRLRRIRVYKTKTTVCKTAKKKKDNENHDDHKKRTNELVWEKYFCHMEKKKSVESIKYRHPHVQNY